MGLTELKIWQYRCDRCQEASEAVQSYTRPSLPFGWSTMALTGFGLCGGTKHLDLCSKCTKRDNEKSDG